ncbi:hypothetical protein F441_00970 [Phytophthora nicotianae CJ01A1]|uniref:Peptidase S54 rhomboid domain-containing protein n=6 Tax=Phytophthora nicotianae TaxID=4792 RepID=W2RJ14_PHYN3|nr:hypothetical protein PPTG_00850 [Phytophthora nicotianae INRA-310]ETI56457.1 hypothetical protein F443_00996 [Phytophthora nicotianae P1569]ETM02665.1 hypothetical protein L917_00889 [Phytophthora nicotianae]ETO85262.1 hypothetical protein F444_01002 [Phytophthora nicotianae P1976]ETP26264.1 hypothetical protein F441_00970 [Phytophthora nicotianae CJ01A1]ETP54280.1 hypothetical protein F442_00948 [Phytophthora nicotianae P10297]KUG00354.1 hypothetical protein AM587_10016749 [Phytophthora n
MLPSRLLTQRRQRWHLSTHNGRYPRSVRRTTHQQRALRPPLPPEPSTESTSALLALLVTIGGIQVCSSPMASSFESAAFITRNFETSRSQVQHGRAYTLITSTLYTPTANFALLNVLWLVISGRHVCRTLGNAPFIALYAGSGTLANTVSLAIGREVTDDPVFPRLQLPGGASCAVDAVVTLNALLYPPSRVALTRRWMRWPLWLFSAIFLTRDERERPFWQPNSAPRESHFTGVLCGLATFLALRRPSRYRVI